MKILQFAEGAWVWMARWLLARCFGLALSEWRALETEARRLDNLLTYGPLDAPVTREIRHEMLASFIVKRWPALRIYPTLVKRLTQSVVLGVRLCGLREAKEWDELFAA